jgi:hypothetical protein
MPKVFTAAWFTSAAPLLVTHNHMKTFLCSLCICMPFRTASNNVVSQWRYLKKALTSDFKGCASLSRAKNTEWSMSVLRYMVSNSICRMLSQPRRVIVPPPTGFNCWKSPANTQIGYSDIYDCTWNGQATKICKRNLPERSLPPGARKDPNRLYCHLRLYVERSSHQNLEKKPFGGVSPTRSRKRAKSAIL